MNRPSGNRLPAEWEPHKTTWIGWPCRRSDWPGKFGPIPWVYTEIVRHLVRSEPVQILVPSAKIEGRASAKLGKTGVDLGRVLFWQIPINRNWLRDSGPMFVVNDRDLSNQTETDDQSSNIHIVDWKFNAWAKYDDWKRDNRIPKYLSNHLNIKRRVPRIQLPTGTPRAVLEGGAIDVNGQGTLLTTEECLLSEVQQRNPGLDRSGYEELFAQYLGVSQVIWLGRGIAGDDTHGHVDDITRFVGPDTIVTCVEDDRDDPNYGPLLENRDRLRDATDQDGRPLRVVELPMPEPIVFDGQRLPASYANFYIANSVVLVPTFNDPADRDALAILADLFPGRTVVGIHAVDLVWGFGTIHCLTRDQPERPNTI